MNRGLVVGDDRFKLEIEAALQRRVEPGKHGGDGKSERFLEEVRNQRSDLLITLISWHSQSTCEKAIQTSAVVTIGGWGLSASFHAKQWSR
ncbi:Uncharacterised protein [BD1-7 clade bacterium]|uniref:Uncharacterized protein n=1 Tax=BD1-7 clade bacterium TaxID=2029982 RepID=A0A5S9Q898_9GAMM|nr:Uncharacterised protein [BD1-7 clade bacterium]CAA0113403.1 Uncharacterised protein [BD1-7 clade bacterium]